MQDTNETTELLMTEIRDIVKKCVRCRFCFSECPVYEVSNRWVTNGSSGMTQALYYGVMHHQLDESLRDILARCTTCRSCEVLCEKLMAGVSLVQAILKGRQLLLEEGVQPLAEQQKTLEYLQTLSNPYGQPPSKKNEWLSGLDVPEVDPGLELQTMYFVGCTTAYDDRVQKVGRALVRILKAAGVSFGVMRDEKCCGDVAKSLGEETLAEFLMEENSEDLLSAKAANMLVNCPHGYDSFKKYYPPELSDRMPLQHHTQLIWQLIDSNKLSLKNPFEGTKRVTYHDPCYLGKYNGIYEEPRKVLGSLPGIEVVEMRRNKEKSFCCGGGGGRMWADFDENPKLNEVRVGEAKDAGADILVTACPFCLINFEDATKTMNIENELKVMDLAELVIQCM
jgi:Fe-S oxidoreductase